MWFSAILMDWAIVCHQPGAIPAPRSESRKNQQIAAI
jgi:hypothetical protein